MFISYRRPLSDFRVIPVYGDGLCILNAFRTSLKIERPTKELYKEISNEIMTNLDIYAPYMRGECDIVDELNKYGRGLYDHDTGDIILYAVANRYCTRVVVHDVAGGEICITPRDGDELVVMEAHIRRNGHHYDGLVLNDEHDEIRRQGQGSSITDPIIIGDESGDDDVSVIKGRSAFERR
jgi:hypothetical protein